MSTIRQEQIQHMLVQEVSDMLQRDLKDPRLQGAFITVTGAEVTRDLRYAKVFVSIMGDETAQKDGMAALHSAAGRIAGKFTRRAHLRVAPEIDFRPDEAIARGARIFDLLQSIDSPDKPKNES